MIITQANRDLAVHAALHAGYSHWPYKYGGLTSDGIDCSGLTVRSWTKGGVTLPHNSGMQAVALKAVPYSPAMRSKMLPGDLFFYNGTTPENVGHVAMYCERFDALWVCAQATDPADGTEVIRFDKYGLPVYIGYVR